MWWVCPTHDMYILIATVGTVPILCRAVSYMPCRWQLKDRRHMESSEVNVIMPMLWQMNRYETPSSFHPPTCPFTQYQDQHSTHNI